MASPAALHHRGRIAALSRSRTPDDPELLDEKRNLRAIRLQEFIEEKLAERPPLTADQLSDLAGILRGASR